LGNKFLSKGDFFPPIINLADFLEFGKFLFTNSAGINNWSYIVLPKIIDILFGYSLKCGMPLKAILLGEINFAMLFYKDHMDFLTSVFLFAIIGISLLRISL